MMNPRDIGDYVFQDPIAENDKKSQKNVDYEIWVLNHLMNYFSPVWDLRNTYIVLRTDCNFFLRNQI